ncbi:hypothetical protein NESM_000103200 [Novymonas esmeraldas]|uniref:Transmembrane protein n=1 Tax=Novymonas esmeraldas TaxID=1808958 RepID=A0AAW0F250_9TRYP
MAKSSGSVEKELTMMKVPGHSLPTESHGGASPAASTSTATLGDNSSAPSAAVASQGRPRRKPNPAGGGAKLGYQRVLDDIERRRGREMRRALRAVEAGKRRWWYRVFTLVFLIVVALGVGYLTFFRFA